MGFFDLLKAKKAAAQASQAKSADSNQTNSEQVAPSPAPNPEPRPATEILTRLNKARACLEMKDLEGAMAIYESLLAEAGDRADVLVSISGELGLHGHVQEIVEHIAPRYDAKRHGAAAGINVIQAYLVLKNIEASQHILSLLFSLNRADLEERLHGFSNAIADLIEERRRGIVEEPGPQGQPVKATHINLVTISKPIWFYGLEEMAAELLPQKGGKLRRVAFAQLSVLGVEDLIAKMKQPEDRLGRLSRAIPLWLAETFHFCPQYDSIAALGMLESPEMGRHFAMFGVEWTAEHLRQLIETNKEPLDYVFTGAIKETAGDTELVLRLWEVKKLRERKQITVRWTPETEELELRKLHEDLRVFMEHTPCPAGQGLAYAAPSSPRAWLDSLGASAAFFLAEKGVISPSQVSQAEQDMVNSAQRASLGVRESLAHLTLVRRVRLLKLVDSIPEATLVQDPLVEKARALTERATA